MADQPISKRSADFSSEITSLLDDLPLRFVAYVVLARCLRRCSTVFEDVWPAKPSGELRRAASQWMATEKRVMETLSVPARGAAQLESLAHVSWDDAFLQHSTSQLVARFLSLVAFAEACDEQPGMRPCGDVVRATLCAELFVFTSFNNACAERAQRAGAGQRGAEISRLTLEVVQQLPEPFRQRFNHPRRHLQAFFACLPLEAWREGEFAEPLQAAIRADVRRLSEYVRNRQISAADAEGMMARMAATDLGPLNADLWSAGLPVGWPTPKPIHSYGEPPPDATAGPTVPNWGQRLVRRVLTLTIILVPLVFGSSWLLQRYGFLKYDNFGREPNGTPSATQPLERRPLSAQDESRVDEGDRDPLQANMPLSLTEPVRTWADDTGQHQTRATLVEIGEGSVTLEKEDGIRRVVELSRLSPQDVEYVQQRQQDCQIAPASPVTCDDSGDQD